MNTEEIDATLAVALTSQDDFLLQDAVRSIHPAHVAAALTIFDPKGAADVLTRIEPERRGDVFGYLPSDVQELVIASLDNTQLAALLGTMDSDDRADVFAELPEPRKQAVLPALDESDRADVRRLTAYEDGTVGAIMTTDFATLMPGQTASAAIDRLRRLAPDKETIYATYVVDADRQLVGTVELSTLLLAEPNQPIHSIMRKPAAWVNAAAPQEDAARCVRDYDLIAVPVVNGEGHLIGIVTHDDALDVVENEATVDMLKVGGFGLHGGHDDFDSSTSLAEAPIGLLYRKRITWLVLLVFGNIFSGAGIAHFEDVIAANVTLVFFLPLLIDSGGNAGSQSATITIRSLATGELDLADWSKMLGRELLVAILLGVTMAAAVSTLGFARGGPAIAAVVSLTMVIVVLLGSVIGFTLPFILSRLRFDPATASAPLITTIADASGVLVYFLIASTLLPLFL